MMTAKIFENGRSQAVRLPKEFRFKDSEVGIARLGEAVMLFPKDSAWGIFLNGLGSFTYDFMENGREQCVAEERRRL